MTITQLKEILKVAEEIAVTSRNPQNEVLEHLRKNKINATPEMAEEIVDKIYGEFDKAYELRHQYTREEKETMGGTR